MIATGEQVNQQVSIVHQGDAASLLDNLREQGVEEEDLQELGYAVASEPEAVDGKLRTQSGSLAGRHVDQGGPPGSGMPDSKPRPRYW